MEVLTDNNIALVEDLVLDDRRLKVKEIAQKSRLSDTTVRRIVHDHLGMNKINAMWVPKYLPAIQRQRRVESAQSFLELCGENPVDAPKTNVTGHETMVLY